jgi:hypothetical protein
VHDAGDVVDVDAPSNDVGRHEGIRPPTGETGKSACPLTLGSIAVDGCGRHPRGSQLAGDPIGPVPGTAEHERLAIMGDDLRRDRHPLVAGHPPEVVGDLRLAARLGSHLTTDGLALIAPAERLDLHAHGCREQEDLAVRRRLVEEAAHRTDEAHIDHAVSLVHDDRTNLAQVKVAAGHEVLKAARTADHDLDPAAKGLPLGAIVDAAVNGDDPTRIAAQNAREDTPYLIGELPGGHQDKCPRGP